MIHVDPIEPNDENWKQWREDAKEATKNMTSAAEVKEAMYKRGRDKILELFHDKCAYCESKITANQNLGDVDHFRPKSRVRDEQGNVVTIDGTHPHPGYFWLAYDWMNLLPACISCNRPRKTAKGEAVGKSDLFPLVDPSKRARERDDDIAQETPVLLNPYDPKVDLSKHLVFDPVIGTVSGLTKEGKETIRILDLNREGLRDERQKRAIAAEDAWNFYVLAIGTKNAPMKAMRLQQVNQFMSGAEPYSAIARVAIENARNELLGAIAPTAADGP